MQDHVERVVPPWRPAVHHEVAAHGGHPPLQLDVPSRRHGGKQFLDPRDVSDAHPHGECVPVEHVGERQRIVAVVHDDGHALEVDGLGQPRAGHLVPAGAQAEAAAPHHVRVRHAAGEVLAHLHVRVAPVLPVLQQDGPHRAVVPARKEGQDGPVGRRGPAYLPVHDVSPKVDLRQRNVLGWVEAL
ncbi:hypothetical protein PR202_gb12541 [Eleusine coracana subsp. coracana]|uniref:Uncharacterized protein n=1 Tax=Eleusine coracana subsp. coracana TaxID=191504 RepID=A0AAV5EN47_ELECO|nr:hypothetical protein PR202_gb12541 [Eleusine coracana subsp. coracana]